MRAKERWFSGRRLLSDHGWWALGSVWLAAVIWAFMNGPRLYAVQEQEIVIEAEAESQAVCQRLGMPPGDQKYFVCASELSEVRRQHKLRIERHLSSFI